jgi:hypothetical protein
MDNIQLTPFEDTSDPFDLDAVYKEGRQRIQTSIDVTRKIQLIDVNNTSQALMTIVPSKEPILKLPGQKSYELPTQMVVDLETPQVFTKDTENPVDPDALVPNKDYEPSEVTMKAARKLLFKKVQAIEIYIDSLPPCQESKQFITGCIRAERKAKKRKSVLDFLEEKFLAMLSEGED